MARQANVDRLRTEAERFDGPSVDVEMMRTDIKTQNTVLNEIGIERERLKVEDRAAPRVTLLQRAEVPESKD